MKREKYEEFVELFSTRLEEQLASEGATVNRHKVRKINEQLDGLLIKYPNVPAAPTVYLEGKYEQYMEGRTVERIVADTLRLLKEARPEAPILPELSAEEAKKRLYCAVINRSFNKELLADCPHEDFEDLAVVARFRVSDDSSFLVSSNMCRIFSMSPEEIMRYARINTENDEFILRSISDVIKTLAPAGQGEGVNAEAVPEIAEEDCPIYALTNSRGVDGAAVLLSKSAMKRACECLREEFYILPSSRHEVILVPESSAQDVEILRRMVCEVNACEVSLADRLSDSVYRYSLAEERVVLAGEQ